MPTGPPARLELLTVQSEIAAAGRFQGGKHVSRTGQELVQAEREKASAIVV